MDSVRYAVPIFLLSIPVFYFLWVVLDVSSNDTPTKKMINKVLKIIAVLFVAALVVFMIVVNIPKKPSIDEQLDEIREEIGTGGILDYVASHWSDQEIIEYLYPELFDE